MKKLLPFILIALTSCSRYAFTVQSSIVTGVNKGRIETTPTAKAKPFMVKVGDTLQVISRAKLF